MNLNFYPFQDVRPEPKTLFRKEMGVNPEEAGNPKSEEKIPFSGSEMTHAEYNDTFEGDSWSIPTEKGHIGASFRNLEFQSDGEGTTKMTVQAKEGWFGTRLFAQRSHAHFVTGGGDDTVQHDGNTQRNISVVEAGSGKKLIVQNLEGGDDKSVLYLDNPTGTIIVNGGEGNDQLHIHHRSPKNYTLIQDPETLPDPNDRFNGLRIVTQGIEEIHQYNDFN